VPTFNSMYLEHLDWGGGGHTLETPLTVASAVNDMLLQSWGDKIRIFPAVPKNWTQISFTHLRAEGGFIVSAKRENGLDLIEILSKESCKISLCVKDEEFTIFVTKNLPFLLKV